MEEENCCNDKLWISATSTDGINWTQSSSTKLVSGSGGSDYTAHYAGMTYGNNLFVFVGYYRHSPSTSYIWYSSDGASWQSKSTDFGTDCLGNETCNIDVVSGIAYGTLNISEYPAP
jgi:hypothetical protein